MILGGDADGKIGANIDFVYPQLRNDKILFSESPGFVFEVEEKNAVKVQSVFRKHDLIIHKLGSTTKKDSLKISNGNKKIIDLKIDKMKKAWTTGFIDALK